MKKLIFALICTIVAVSCSNSAFAAFIKLDAAGQQTTDDAACVMVKDNVTNLIWERKTASNKDQTYTWDDAEAYTESLVLGGNSDWRLPTIRELQTLIDFGKTSPAINSDYFPNITNNQYWTSTIYMIDGVDYSNPENPVYTKRWYINFLNGVDAGLIKSALNRVIAVRGGALPTPSFTADNTRNVVTDNNSGLIWQKTPGSATNMWANIATYLNTLPGVPVNGKYYGWRLPTVEELKSIVNYETSSPTVYSEFSKPSTPFIFWTSTEYAADQTKAWYADFSTGAIFQRFKTTAYRVWAVVDTSKEIDPPANDFPKGDITHDKNVDLMDVIAGLKVLDGITVTVYTDTDVNGDGKIGQEEVIYALQVTALRPQQ